MNIKKVTSVEIDMKNIHYKLLDEKSTLQNSMYIMISSLKKKIYACMCVYSLESNIMVISVR